MRYLTGFSCILFLLFGGTGFTDFFSGFFPNHENTGETMRAMTHGLQAMTYPAMEPDVRLNDDVIAFPFNNEQYLQKMVYISQEHYVWTQKRLQSWARGQGFLVTNDSEAGGFRYGRALLFYAPGFAFRLKAPVPETGEMTPYGWELVLDMALLRADERGKRLSTDFAFYENILRYEIYIDHIHFKTVEIGYGKTESSPIILPVPYVRDADGQILVEIKIKNHPNAFGIIYDAFIRRSE